MNNTKMNTSFIIERLRHYGSRSLSTAVAALFLMSVIMVNTSALHAQSTTKSPVETTIEGTLNMYLVTNYGEKMQEVDRYRKTGFRKGDNAEMCIIEFVDYNETYTQSGEKKKSTRTRRSSKKATKAEEVAETVAEAPAAE